MPLHASRIALLLLAAATLACGRGDSDSPGRSTGVALTGAGATFPYPLYSRWFSDYANETGVRINYQSIGSGGGIRQISEGTVDFGASDGPMTDEEMSRARGGRILHLPTVAGAVVVTYNLPGVSQTLNLDGQTVANIFLGNVRRWNAPQISAMNPGVALPDREIIVVHRSDGSGTTYVFTDYLTAVSPVWAAGPGRGKEVSWPVGLGGKGNEGVAGQVKQTPGAVGYVELAYASQNRLPAASIRNSSGNFIQPTLESITAAISAAAETLPTNTDYRISIVDPPGAHAYPVSSLTWLLVYEQQPDSTKGRRLVDFLRWALTEGEERAAALDYAPLPESMRRQLLQRLDSLKLGS
ncbi:MAG TPA: phosphate ABC transporter substrate-binding protein PstS [Gemmatimonadaceae bacterium]|nr:phosphate ABC transporter substrate-binding protein PstS [Gemmatimonadaceae bacterium]